MSPELVTFLIAMSPVVELRGSIPWAIASAGLPVWSAYFWSVLGNMVPLCLIVLTSDFFLRFFSARLPFVGNIAARVFEHTRAAHESKMARWGKGVVVILLVATPIPFVGGWTGAIAAFVFGVKIREAFPFLLAGSLLGGLIVMAFTLGLSALL
ncbi:MAG TPA: small multi-drug export protein [Candidatus Paceibacterota bacterium]